MTQQTRKFLYITLIAMTIAVMAFGVYAYEKQKTYKVAVMFSQGKDVHCYGTFIKSFEKELKRQGINANISYHYLDCDRWGHNEEVEEARRLIDQACINGDPDMFVTIGDEVTYSFMTTCDTLTKTLPVVFGAVAFPNPGLLKANPNLTGFTDSLDAVKNIYLAQKICGIYAVNTLLSEHYLDKQVKKRIKMQIAEHPEITDNIGWDHTMYEIFKLPEGQFSITPFSLYNLDKNTAMGEKQDSLGNENLMLAMNRFSKMTYMQMKYDSESIMMVNMSSKKPMLSATWLDFGAPESKFIAGFFAGAEAIAADVAERAAKILRGAKPQDFTVRPTKQEYWIDWNVAKKYGYNKNNLPAGFNVVNLSWKEMHHKLYNTLIYGSIILCLIVMALLFRLYIKERKQKHKALIRVERENTLFNMAIENSQAFAWERYGTTMHLSDAFWHHYGHEPHVCDVSEFMDMIHPDYRAEYLKGVEKVNNGDNYKGEVKADFYRNGEWHWYQIRGKGVFDKGNNYVRSYGMLLKVDEFKMKEFQLVEARRLAEEATLKESFLSNMSHEIRTPLNAIVGFSQLLAQPDADFTPEEKTLFAETINTNNDLLLKLINDIIDLSRVESGEIPFVIKSYSVREVVSNAYEKYKPTMPSDIGFRMQQPEGDSDPMVDIDINQLSLVFDNLISNAVKFTEQGYITIGWEPTDDNRGVDLYVEDTGSGLSDDEQKMVFNRFYKKDKFQQGTGLGLSICKAIAIRQGGDMDVKSRLGKGTRFTIHCMGGVRFLGEYPKK